MPVEELQLAERLISYDTSRRTGLDRAMDFVAGWLDARGLKVERRQALGRGCVLARTGHGPVRIILHGHLDVVPGHPEQFVPRREGALLFGRGAYDMKAALGAMMLALCDSLHCHGVETTLVVVPDEEQAEPGQNSTEALVASGMRADFVICGEPTDMLVGVQSKGVLMLRADVTGVAAHGSTPWLGQNAVLGAVDRFRAIERLPFALESTPLFASPSINLGRIHGGDAVNKVPDHCRMDIDVRYLPGQDPQEVLRQVRTIDGMELQVLLERPPAYVDPDHPMVRTLLDAVGRHEPSVASVGRVGASDAVAFLGVGVPAVEFGPRGAGHHGPHEHVDVESLVDYRRALADFLRLVGAQAHHPQAEAGANAGAGI